MSTIGVASIIGAGASAIGTGASIASGIKSVSKQKKLMDYQNKIHNENYDKMLADSRDYQAVVEAAKRAGLNPLVALGQSAGAGSVQGTSIPAESNLPGIIASGAGSVGSSISNLDLIGKQKELLGEQAEAQRIDNAIQRKELGNADKKIEAENSLRDLQNEYQGFQNTIAGINAQYAQWEHNAWLQDDKDAGEPEGSSYGYTKVDEKLDDAKLKAEQWKNLQENTKVLSQQAENLKMQYSILKQAYDQNKEINPALVSKVYAEIAKLMAEIDSLGISDIMEVFKTLHDVDMDVAEFKKSVIDLKWDMTKDVAEHNQKDRHKIMDNITNVAVGLFGLIGLSWFKKSTPPRDFKPKSDNQPEYKFTNKTSAFGYKSTST